MKTSIKYDQFKSMDKETQLKSLAGAIRLEMLKPVLCTELLGHKGFSNVHSLNKASNDGVFDIIKSYLATKYNTTSDNPILNDVANQFEQFYHTNMPEMDMAFTLLYDMIDLRNSTHDHFDIIDTNAGLTWTQKQPGERIEIRKAISEDKATVNYLEFSDGLGLLDTWLQFDQFWRIDEAIDEFRATYYDKMAGVHYDLLTALGAGVNVAFDTDDATTMNKAASAILRAVRSKGYGVGQNTPFYAVCAPEKVGRLERMLTAQRGSAIVDYGTIKEPLSYRIAGVIGTTHVTAADTGWYLVLPGKKIKRGIWKDLTVEDQRNIYTKAQDLTGVGQYNAAIGDTDQVRRVLYA